jgi:hypothetical protein
MCIIVHAYDIFSVLSVYTHLYCVIHCLEIISLVIIAPLLFVRLWFALTSRAGVGILAASVWGSWLAPGLRGLGGHRPLW